MMLQLDPPIPVFIVAGNGWPEGSGYAMGWIDYSQEHFTLWKVAMDAGGAVFDVPQSHIRLQFNVSMGRVRQAATEGIAHG